MSASGVVSCLIRFSSSTLATQAAHMAAAVAGRAATLTRLYSAVAAAALTNTPWSNPQLIASAGPEKLTVAAVTGGDMGAAAAMIGGDMGAAAAMTGGDVSAAGCASHGRAPGTKGAGGRRGAKTSVTLLRSVPSDPNPDDKTSRQGSPVSICVSSSSMSSTAWLPRSARAQRPNLAFDVKLGEHHASTFRLS